MFAVAVLLRDEHLSLTEALDSVHVFENESKYVVWVEENIDFLRHVLLIENVKVVNHVEEIEEPADDSLLPEQETTYKQIT